MFFSSNRSDSITPNFSKSRAAVILYELLNSPLSSMCMFSGFVLYKSLAATSFQLSILTMLKPGVSLLILYWSASIHFHRHRLMQNLVWAGILSRIPFFAFPWINNPWFFIFCMANYLFFHRAGAPAWIEIMKVNLPTSHRGKVYSFATALAYTEGFLLYFWIESSLNHNEAAWRWLYPAAAFIGILSILVQKKLPILNDKDAPVAPYISWKNKVINPWSDALNLMKTRPDFRRFQLGFFLGGFGLMMAMTITPIFFVDTLNISYKELAMALLVCQGFGYVLSARVWGHQLHQAHIFKIMAVIISFFLLYGVFLAFTVFSINWLYIAYFIYGVAQAGSRLCWNLSGPLFSTQDKNSSVYSSVNILMVGIRGCIAPLLSTFIYKMFGPLFVLIFFILLCVVAIRIMIRSFNLSDQIA